MPRGVSSAKTNLATEVTKEESAVYLRSVLVALLGPRKRFGKMPEQNTVWREGSGQILPDIPNSLI